MENDSGHLLHRQALSIQWVAHSLRKIRDDVSTGGNKARQLMGNAKCEDGSDSLNALNVGCVYTSSYILPFAVELALKALLQKHCVKYKARHDLAYLYELLPSEIKSKVKDIFLSTTGKNSEYYVSDLKDFFDSHKDDFVNLRYLEDVDKQKVEETKYQYVLASLLTAYMQ